MAREQAEAERTNVSNSDRYEEKEMRYPDRDMEMENIKRQIREELQGEMRQEQRRKKRRKWLLLLLLLLLFLLGGFFLYRYLGERETDSIQRELNAEVGILPGMSEEEIQDRLNRNVAEGRLNISINPLPEFADGKSEGNINIENIKGNKYSFAVTITCIGASEDPGAQDHVNEVVMKTGLIDPGSYVDYKKLDVDLPKGEYTCVATFDAYRTVTDEKTGAETYEKAGAAGSQILITVKE